MKRVEGGPGPLERGARAPASPSAANARVDSRKPAAPRRQAAVDVEEIESLRHELERVAHASTPPRWNANPDDVQRSVVKLVLTLIEFIRQLLERQAIRRMDAGTLTPTRPKPLAWR